jgi:hypothetical protein
MRAVCPACRTAVSLSSYVCPRCGLAMRPTFQRCAEPVMVGLFACGRCGEHLEDFHAPASPSGPSPVPGVAARAPVTQPIPSPPEPTPWPPQPTASVTEPIPVVREPIPVVREPIPPPAVRAAPAAYPLLPVESVAPGVAEAWDGGRRPRRGALRWMAIVIATGLLVTAGLMALSVFGPNATNPAPEDVELTERIFSRLGIALSLPPDWQIDESASRLEAEDPRHIGGQSVQGVVVRFDDRPPPVMDRRNLEDVNRARVTDYVVLQTDTDTTVDGSAAVHHAFLGDGLRFEQWWVAHGDGSIWIEFWSRQVDDNAFVLHRRILESLERL